MVGVFVTCVGRGGLFGVDVSIRQRYPLSSLSFSIIVNGVIAECMIEAGEGKMCAKSGVEMLFYANEAGVIAAAGEKLQSTMKEFKKKVTKAKYLVRVCVVLELC